MVILEYIGLSIIGGLIAVVIDSKTDLTQTVADWATDKNWRPPTKW